jgi:Arginine methyltransferase-interacting protein, contains RING Zn-finger
MDIDRTNAARRPPTTCYRCGATGHLQRDCPRAFDVRHMSVAELQEQLEFLLAREAEAEETAGAAPEAEAQEDEEGFVERDE